MSGGKRKAGASSGRKRTTSKKPAQSPWRARLKKGLKWSGITGLVLALIGAVAFVVLYNTIDVPDPNAEFQTETTYVYFADGKSELGRYATQNRDSIPFGEMPQSIKDAVVAAENRSFWTDQGIDPKGIIRSAFSNAQGNGTQGASTITQQYVKILYLSSERTYKRKIREAIVSLKLVRQQSKEQILEGYLNTIYFGRGAYGIEAAAHAFFNKKAKDLTVPESAVLASVLNNPSRFDPANGEDSEAALLGRYQYVLNSMAEMGNISASQADEFAQELPEFPEIKGEQAYAGQKGHSLELVRRELIRLGFSEQEINGGGLRVTTTLQKKVMDASLKAVREEGPKGKDLHVATASVEPGTGALRGFYGGQDFLDSQINWAVSGGAPGSTFKVFALAAGLKAGFALKDTFDGNSPYKIGNTNIRNQGNRDYGRVNLIKATEDSINTAFIELTEELPNGAQDVVDTAVDMGIPAWDKNNKSMDRLHNSPGLLANAQVALGSATVSPINMANGYATIANRGRKADVYVIEKVVDASGETRYQHKNSTERVLDEDIADDVSFALEQTIRQGSGTKARALGRPAGGKTGTATNADDDVSSSWFVGFTPQLATAVMITKGTGNESIEGEVVPFFGGTYPAQIWTDLMSRALEGEEEIALPKPAYVDGDAPADGHAPYTPPPKPTETASESPSESPTTSAPPSPSGPSTTLAPPAPTTIDPSGPCTIDGCPTDPAPTNTPGSPNPTGNPGNPGNPDPPGGGGNTEADGGLLDLGGSD